MIVFNYVLGSVDKKKNLYLHSYSQITAEFIKQSDILSSPLN